MINPIEEIFKLMYKTDGITNIDIFNLFNKQISFPIINDIMEFGEGCNFFISNKIQKEIPDYEWHLSSNAEMVWEGKLNNPINQFAEKTADFKSFFDKNVEVEIEINEDYSDLRNKFKESIGLFDKSEKIKIAEKFLKHVPLYYDNAKVWWYWSNESICWKKIDDIDICNLVFKITGLNTINSKERSEILQALMQVSRSIKPKQIKKTWIQFKDKIIDVEDGEIIQASPKYFITNPIPFEIGNSEDTPTMDKIFVEWVGEEHKELLYEILAYCLIPDYPIHRLFCFVGSGLNGKSRYLELLSKFIGKVNVTTTELDTLLESRFELTRLYKKLVCLMGETNFSEMSKTAILKKLTGQDMIAFEFKHKDLFEEYNYAKILISTNTLPITTDKTIGFYRRWLIIDFPNQFTEDLDILSTIPEIEYHNLAKKSIRILSKLLQVRKFTNEGSIEHRAERYEEKSNPLGKFIKDQCIQDPDANIFKYEFKEGFLAWLKSHNYRQWTEHEIGREMKKIYSEGREPKFVENETKYYHAWLGIKFKKEDIKKSSITSRSSTISPLKSYMGELSRDRVEIQEDVTEIIRIPDQEVLKDD